MALRKCDYMPAKQESLKKNVILNVFYHIFLIITPLITAPYASRVLQSDGIGIYSYSNSLVTYFTVFAALGTVSYGTREIARNRNDKSKYSKAFWEIELLTIFTSLASLAVWIILALTYSEYKIYLLILSFQILATCFDISWLYFGLEKYSYTISINSIFKILGIVAIFVFVKSPDDLEKYVLINTLVHLLGNLSMWFFLPFVLSKTKIEIKSLKVHFHETIIYFVPSIATVLYTVLDKTLIGLLVQGETIKQVDGVETIVKNSDLENGYYEQATSIITMVKTICFTAINSVMSSRSSFLFKKGDMTGVKQIAQVTFDVTLFLSIGAAFGISAISSIFVPLFFGPGYDKTIILLVILSFIVPVVCVSSVVGTIYYTPVGKRKQSSIYTIIGSLVNLVLSIPLILLIKSYGAALASLIAEIFITFLYVKKSDGFASFGMLFHLLWKKILAGILMFSAVFTFIYFMNGIISSFWLVLISVFGGAILYLLFVFLFRDSFSKTCLDRLSVYLKRGKHKENH